MNVAAGEGAGGGPAGRRREFVSHSEADTSRLGAAFATAFRPDPARAIRVGLSGDLGAGKTTFVRGLLRRLGVEGPIRSPTYSLVERHEAGGYEVLHGDLYRLESPAALAALALDEFDHGGALWLIEWPEQGGTALPPSDVLLSLAAEAAIHRVVAVAGSAAGVAWLDRLGDAIALEVARTPP